MGAELFLPLMFQEDTFGFTAFMHAVRNNKLKIVSFFLDSINSYDLIQSILSKPSNQRDITDSLFFKNFGSTISTQLESACENSLIEKILIKKDHCWERNAISHAIAGNSPVMLSLLINTIHDQSSLLEKLLTDYDKFGQTPLMLTIKKNNSQLLFELLHITRKNPSLFEKILYQKDRCRLFNSYELAHENNNDMLDELLWWKNNIES